MHFTGVPMDTLGTKIRERYRRRHHFSERLDMATYWKDGVYRPIKKDKEDTTTDKDEGGTN